jgi:hypothetical protein
MDPNVLENSSIPPEPRNSLLKWLMVLIIILLVGGAGYWYYSTYIAGGKGRVSPSPSVEVTDAPWKVKSEKTVNDFMGFWLASGATTDGIVQAKKARDLLTIAAQARLETTKGSDDKPVTIIANQLDIFVGVKEKPSGYEIIATKKIDERTVEVRLSLKFNVNPTQDKVFTLTSEGNIWLIDQVKDYQGISASPSPSPSPSATPQPNTSS